MRCELDGGLDMMMTEIKGERGRQVNSWQNTKKEKKKVGGER